MMLSKDSLGRRGLLLDLLLGRTHYHDRLEKVGTAFRCLKVAKKGLLSSDVGTLTIQTRASLERPDFEIGSRRTAIA